MKRCLLALALLASLALFSLWNVRYLDSLTEDLEHLVSLSRADWQQGDWDAALATLRKATALWESSEGYTHIFIRHDEVNAASDAFFTLLGDVHSGDAETAEESCEALLYHLESIRVMEHITLKSVF